MAAVMLLVLPGCQTPEDPNGAVSASPSVGQAGTGDTPVLREALQEARSRSRGSFTEERIADGTVSMLHWVDYDLDASVQDHRFGVPAAGSGATFEEPDLRFLIYSDRALMWNPRAAQACGTPWVEMPPEQVAPATVTVKDDTIAEVQAGMGEEVAAALEEPGSDEEVGELVFRWTMGPGRQGEFDEPEDVADMSCLESP